MSLKKIGAIARKEYYHLIRDFRSLYLAFFIPLLLILLFGYALSLDVDRIPTAVVDHSKTPESRDFIESLNASLYFDVVAYPPSTEKLTRLIDENRVVVGIVIPPDWTARLKAEKDAPLQVIIDGSDPNYAGNTRAYLMAVVGEKNRKRLLTFLNRRGRESIAVPVEARVRVWFNEALESKNFIVPGIIAIIIMIVGALLTSLVIAREYENGTMETIRSLPVRASEFFFGKALCYWFITLVDVLVAVLMGQVLFGVVMKSNFWLMILASMIYISVALSLGLLISVKTRSQLMANQMAILLTYLPSLLLSDFIFPQENMPVVLKAITFVVPATYYIDILNGLYLRHLDFFQMWENFAVLAVMAGILLFLNIRALKKEGL